MGGRSVEWSTDSAGAARRGNVHVVSDSLRGSFPESREHGYQIGASSNKWRVDNKKVAKKMAVAINRILRRHNPNLPEFITAHEPTALICLLDDIHGIKLNGFGDSESLR